MVKTGKFVIPEKGHAGFCPEAGVVYITVDPENNAFCKNYAHSIKRMFAHELHHAARWQELGYGSTLGEALVSKGLAGHFSLELFGGESELWERLTLDLVQPYTSHLHDNWQRTDYDHNAMVLRGRRFAKVAGIYRRVQSNFKIPCSIPTFESLNVPFHLGGHNNGQPCPVWNVEKCG